MSTIRLPSGVTTAYVVNDHTDPWVDRDAVLMLHGFARGAEFWNGWVPHLSRSHPVVRTDLPGCGRSPDPGPTFRYATNELTALVVDLLDALGLRRTHLVGESSGGILAANVAATVPDRVASVTLVSTPLRPAVYDRAVKSAGYDTAEEAMDALGMGGWWRESRRLGDELTGDAARDEYYEQLLDRTSVRVGRAFWAWIHDPSVDLTTVLPRIAAPALIMSPGRSHATWGDQQTEMAAMLPNGRHRRYDDLNHDMYYLEPDRLALDLANFLSTVHNRK